MSLIYKLFKLDRNSREGVVSATSILSIIVNISVALLKVVVGILAASIAIISEGVNNATDALSSLLTLIGIKLANRKPNKEHPFGYGRMEYITNLIISAIIILSGTYTLKDSVVKIFFPEELNTTLLSIILVAVSAVIKYVLGTYTISQGKKVNSDTLIAVGMDCRNDSFVSLVTIGVSLVYILFGKNIDAFAGVFTSYLILKAGYEIMSKTISELLGQPADEELARELYRKIRSTDGVINAVDMVLHNYGPDMYTGSVNVEVDHKMTAAQIFEFLRVLQGKIYEEHRVAMVFGIYAVDNDSKDNKKLRKQITDFAKSNPHIKSYHAVYSDAKSNSIYCDIVVDYDADRKQIYQDFSAYLQELYPDKNIQVNLDTEFV
ncbi:MAG: cation transporter [Erysipelotrichaceae bacterium]|nr:cation transporter [Erysipelotrichaceae bacterium]